jgi:hypothetical protein
LALAEQRRPTRSHAVTLPNAPMQHFRPAGARMEFQEFLEFFSAPFRFWFSILLPVGGNSPN